MKAYDPKIHHRRSLRLANYDYSQAGAYFVTLCSFNRKCIFGSIENDAIQLNNLGNKIQEEWVKSAQIRTEIELNEFVVMPNHLHGIVFLRSSNEGEQPLAPTKGLISKSLPSLIAGFKSAVTKRYNTLRGKPGEPIWQRNYHEHIIRNDADFSRIAEYILDNPRRWQEDSLNPVNNTIVGASGRSPINQSIQNLWNTKSVSL